MDSERATDEGMEGGTPALHKALGQRFRALREQRDLSQEDVGRRLGRSQQWVQKIEAGETRFPLAQFLACCRLYEVEPGSVVPGGWAAHAGFAETAAPFEAAPLLLSEDDQRVLAAYRAIRDGKLRSSVLRIMEALPGTQVQGLA